MHVLGVFAPNIEHSMNTSLNQTPTHAGFATEQIFIIFPTFHRARLGALIQQDVILAWNKKLVCKDHCLILIKEITSSIF